MGIAYLCNYCKYTGPELGLCSEKDHRCKPLKKIEGMHVSYWECQCCSNYRADPKLWQQKRTLDRRTKQPVEEEPRDHICIIEGKGNAQNNVWERYGEKHPYDWNDPDDDNKPACCDACRGSSEETCDVDPHLNLGCSACEKRRCGGSVCKKEERERKEKQKREKENGKAKLSWKEKKGEKATKEACQQCLDIKRCDFHGRELRARPKPRAQAAKWYRHACESCAGRGVRKIKKKLSGDNDPDGKPCSWLFDRNSWTDGCEQCKHHKRMCTNGGFMKGRSSGDPDPDRKDALKDWKLEGKNDPGHMILSNSTPWRKQCKRCRIDGVHCIGFFNDPDTSCNRCWQMGIDCVTIDEKVMTLGSLSKVGHGDNSPFRSCQECQRTDGNCDRQRPCDSCFQSGKEHLCDSWTKNVKESMGCFNGRLNPPPGPLYYLALGYGAGGISDIKDGKKLEHWIGPPQPLYGHSYVLKGKTRTNLPGLVGISMTSRHKYMPQNVPPSGFDMEKKQPSSITTTDIVKAMLSKWPGAFPPADYPTQWKRINEKMRQTVGKLPKAPRPAPLTPGEIENRRSKLEKQQAQQKFQTSQLFQAEQQQKAQQQQKAEQDAGFQAHSAILSGQYQNQRQQDPEVDYQGYAPMDIDPDMPIYSELYNVQSQLQPQAQAQSQPGADHQEYAPMDIDPDMPIEPKMYNVQSQAQQEPQAQPQVPSPILNPYGQLVPSRIRDTWVFPHKYPHYTDEEVLAIDADSYVAVEVEDVPSPPVPHVLDRECSDLALLNPTPRWSHVDPLRHEPPDWNEEHTYITMAQQNDYVPVIYHGAGCAVTRNLLLNVPLDTINGPRLQALEADQPACMEPKLENEETTCGEGDVAGKCCESMVPHHNSDAPFHVCDTCNMKSLQLVFLTTSDIQSMRAYLCSGCTGFLSGGTKNAIQVHKVGIQRVWGRISTDFLQVQIPGTSGMEFRPELMKSTGCACASKLENRRLCRHHRAIYTNFVLENVNQIRQSLLAQFGRDDICPCCMNVIDSQKTSEQGETKAWACLNCGDFVVDIDNTEQVVSSGARLTTTGQVADADYYVMHAQNSLLGVEHLKAMAKDACAEANQHSQRALESPQDTNHYNELAQKYSTQAKMFSEMAEMRAKNFRYYEERAGPAAKKCCREIDHSRQWYKRPRLDVPDTFISHRPQVSPQNAVSSQVAGKRPWEMVDSSQVAMQDKRRRLNVPGSTHSQAGGQFSQSSLCFPTGTADWLFEGRQYLARVAPPVEDRPGGPTATKRSRRRETYVRPVHFKKNKEVAGESGSWGSDSDNYKNPF